VVKLVLLDAGGILLLPEVGGTLAALERFGFLSEVATIDRAHYVGMAAVDEAVVERLDLTVGGLTKALWEESLREVYRSAKKRSLGLANDCPTAVEAELFEAPWTRVGPGAIELLQAVTDRQVPIGIVSNSDGTVEADLKSLRVCQVGTGAGACVTAVIDSAVVGVAKPDPAIFGFALRAAGVDPDQAIFVGDSVSLDVQGALRAGIRGIHFDPYDLCDDPEHEDIRRLAEITPLLDR
jgi:putative hydrolase of the HAD superfamily